MISSLKDTNAIITRPFTLIKVIHLAERVANYYEQNHNNNAS